MANKDFLKLLNATALVSRRSDGTEENASDEGMGPSNNAGEYIPVMVDDGNGGRVQLSVACRVAQQSARARFRSKQDGKDAVVSTLTIFTDYRLDIFERDRFTVDGFTYDTEDINDPGLMHHHLEFVAKRIT